LLEDDRLTNYLKKALDSGNVRAIQHILVSLGVTLDKREKLLGYDETRAAQTKRHSLRCYLRVQMVTGRSECGRFRSKERYFNDFAYQ